MADPLPAKNSDRKERRRRRRRQSDSQLPFSAEILDRMPDAVVIADLDGRIVAWNERAETIFGFAPEEAIGKDLGFHHRPLSGAIGGAALVASALENGEFSGESVCFRRDGSDVPTQTNARIVADADGRPLFAIAILRDVSEQKRAGEEIRRQKEFTDSVIRSSMDGIFAFDRGCRYNVWNPAMERMFGLPASAVLGKRAPDVFPFLEETGEIRFFESALAGERTSAAGRRYETPAGGAGFFDGHYAPISNERGEIVGGLGLIRETSRSRQLEEQLRESQKLESLGTLAGGIAHDFNNILNIVAAYAALIEREEGAKPVIASYLDAIQRTVERGAGVVRQLLTVARKEDLFFGPISLNAVVEELARLLRETFPQKVQTEIDLAADLPPVQGDPNQVLQALLNLCLNARDAMPAGGRLTLRTELCSGERARRGMAAASHDWYACVTVVDTGTGMDAATRQRVFEPFFTTKGRGSGTGLGLAVVQGIAENHGGYVDVESAPGAGSTFRLWFPAVPGSPAQDAAPGAESARPARARGRTVLLVEDEPLLLESVRLLLEGEGYRVLTAADGIAAVEVFQQNRDAIDVLVTDVGLPRLGGWEAFLRMKELDPDLAAILVTGLLEPDKRAQYAAAGVQRALRKPYTAEEMLRCVSEVLGA
jgi:PAS domain S-box-containing protein